MSPMNERGSDAEDEFLSHLPPDTPVFYYKSQFRLESLQPPESPYDSFVVIKAFPPELLDHLDEKLPGRLDYSLSLKVLILKMPSRPHEAAAEEFGAMLTTLANHMKVRRQISYLGSSRVDGEDRKKQADRSWAPVRTQGKFPSVVLEVGYTETAAKLERDIAWWVRQSEGRVKMGITIDIKRGSHNIEIKSWIPARPFTKHVRLTASNRQVVNRDTSLQPPLRIAQKIVIKKGGNGKEPTIEGGSLIIPFKSLLLCEPGEGEDNFVFTEDMLIHDIADFIWVAIEKEEAEKRAK
ncbi:uncharacterized protein TRUGW13939_10628 [Talaromyces rugulosus]|uniref:Uncharacterized protein n=1 Tax=Talaromyces rugulosus TaxID=121627 RepID=A0A7H8RBQ2_TALRU|nr:uncharacterized protein TRUGW13939_10628 [Talaromyces rugulosus]QKX63458.1 hypothetical protein TRUGW13939_10628 [Talaromyces rugulosus]